MAHAITATNLALPTACDPPPIPFARPRRKRPEASIAPGTRIGAWRVDGDLGRGGMASVHAVVHTKFGKRAAVKVAHRAVLSDQLTPATFLREARIVHAIAHPGVIDVFATGSFDGRPYLVMEKLVGRTLGNRIDEGALPRSESIEILLELCDILRAAHDAGVIHRDLKLDNVFLCDSPFAGYRRVKLLDWGVAHVAEEDDPFRGLIAGTLTYVAPEQIRGDALTPAADIYALAVLAYHLLAGRPPFASQNELSLVHMHLRAIPPRASAAWSAIPAALDDLLLRMLAKAPEDRPALDEIEKVLRKALVQIAPARTSLLSLPTRPPVDMLGRPAIPMPPFRAGWIGLAVAITTLAGLISCLNV